MQVSDILEAKGNAVATIPRLETLGTAVAGGLARRDRLDGGGTVAVLGEQRLGQLFVQLFAHCGAPGYPAGGFRSRVRVGNALYACG